MPKDKILHLKGGALALIGSLLIGLFALSLGAVPIAAILIVGGISAAVSVEAAQHNDNRVAMEQGLPSPHEVSALDALYSAAPCLAAAAAAQWLPWTRWIG